MDNATRERLQQLVQIIQTHYDVPLAVEWGEPHHTVRFREPDEDTEQVEHYTDREFTAFLTGLTLARHWMEAEPPMASRCP